MVHNIKDFLLLQFTLLLGLSIYGQVPTDDLYVHLSFDNTYYDFSENGNTPTPNGTNFTTNRFGCENSACYFDGSSTLVFPNQARFQPLTSNSVSFWLKTTQSSRFDLIVQRVGSNSVSKDNYTHIFNHPEYGHEWSYPHYNNLNTAIRNIPINNFNDNEWHHFVYVKDVESHTMRVYYDGNLVIQKTISDIYFEINGTLTIGKWSNYYFEGAIDDLRIYNKALNNAEVQSLFNECTAPCLEINLGQDTTYCDSFSRTLFAGDQYPYYLWSTGETTPSITVSTPDTYWVKGYFENACYSYDTIKIELFSSDEINLGEDIVLCYGASTVLKCGDCFQSYLWSTGDTVSSISVDESGFYRVEAINFNNDTVFDEVNVSILPEIEFSLGEDIYFCPKDPLVEIKAKEGFMDYLWNTGSREKSIFVSEGEYWISVTDQYNCTATDTISVKKYPDIFYFKLFPNPASDYFTIDIHTYCFPEHAVIAELIDMNQRSIIKQWITNNTTTIHIPYDIKEAPYMVKLFNGKGILIKKLIIKKDLY